ncbi:MAG: DUF1192 domain-containing protein [Novosphingobium sp.]
MNDDDRPRLRGDAATRLSSESLDSYSQDELDERIGLLEAEIARVKAHRAAADALFRSGSGG